MFVALTNHLLQSACNRLQSVCAGVVTRVCVISIYSSTISHIIDVYLKYITLCSLSFDIEQSVEFTTLFIVFDNDLMGVCIMKAVLL